MRKIMSTVMAAVVLLGSFAVTVSAEKVSAVNRNEIVANTEIGFEVSEFSFEISESGDYVAILDYKALEDKTTGMEVSVSIDGENICKSDADVMLPRFWSNDELYRIDGQDNQFAPEQLLADDFNEYILNNTADYKSTPYIFNLKAGAHTFAVNCINQDSFILNKVTFKKYSETKSYSEYIKSNNTKNYTGKPIYIEGESAALKSSYWLTSASDASVLVSPSDPVKTKINYIGGANWSEVGDTIYWNVNVAEAGYYKISFSYKQNYILNGKVYRQLKVNGEVPFSEAEAISFPYASNWSKTDFSSDNGEEYNIYLKQGDNTLSLTATLGNYNAICQHLDAVIEEIGDVYLDIAMVTGETVDIYRDYRLFEQIPDFNNRLENIYKGLEKIDEELIKLNGGEVGSYSVSVRNMQQVIQLMIDNPYTAHRYKSTYDSNYTALNSCLNEMQSTPLGIDQIILSAPTSKIKRDNVFISFGNKISFSVRRFLASFTEDYNSISNTDSASDTVTVWVNWGRDQAQILNMLIQSTFSTQNDISVNVKISNASIVQGVLSGSGPDVILQQSRTEPVNLAMRGVLYDLKKFDDCDEVLDRFTDGAEIPYMYNNGLYALPDTQTFFMMFYRTDVFDELGLSVPKTWDEFQEVVRILQRNNLSAWLPYTQLTSMTVANAGVGNLNIFPTLLLQNGISLYNDELNQTTLTQAETISVFNDWTDYYTKMKMSYQLNFYNRFSNGTCPIGIEPYTMYSTLKAAAKEIDGKWLMAPVPGVENADGTINNTTAGGGTGCSILKSAKNPEAAWEFLKWWTSSETQLAYSNNLESVLGATGRVAVANKEAFSSMSWDSSMYQTIYDAWNNVTEIREIPGSYYISRSIDFAFWNVASQNKTPKDVLITWGEEADDEITRKLEQYEKR